MDVTTLSSPPVLLVLTRSGVATAQALAQALPGATIHVYRRRVAVEDGMIPFDEPLAHMRQIFEQGVPMIALCASGIVIRAVAPLIASKHEDPPVLAISPDGASVVPLLGGHRGANALARHVAAVLKGHAAITTAGDTAFGVALDEPPAGWTLANPGDAKAVMAAALDGQTLRVDVAPTLSPALAEWLRAGDLPLTEEGEDSSAWRLLITDRAPEADGLLDGQTLVYHPPVLAVGVGCERETPERDLVELAEQTLADAGLAVGAVACVVSLDLKSDEAAVLALAQRWGVAARFFEAARLEAETPRLSTPSEVVFAEVGCHGVSEGAALAAVGPQGALVVPKVKATRATCAVARAVAPLVPARLGTPRGKLTVVGIGPGTEGWRTPAVSQAIAASSDLVGYGLYLDLLGPLADGKTRHQTDLGKEEDRARKALDLAAEGREVCLVCSGDAGIFALATLVFELLDHEQRPDWKRVDLAVEPGVSAIQAAAARAGAPIGHDFCLLSLSDLLTPRDVILKRIKAVGEGDFVVGFYNPVSLRRRDLLAAARDILLQHRPAETPVILARNLGRAEESVTVVPLAQLSPDMADMLTLVLVGNSESRLVRHDGRDHVYTPRGYGDKWKRS